VRASEREGGSERERGERKRGREGGREGGRKERRESRPRVFLPCTCVQLSTSAYTQPYLTNKTRCVHVSVQLRGSCRRVNAVNSRPGTWRQRRTTSSIERGRDKTKNFKLFETICQSRKRQTPCSSNNLSCRVKRRAKPLLLRMNWRVERRILNTNLLLHAKRRKRLLRWFDCSSWRSQFCPWTIMSLACNSLSGTVDIRKSAHFRWMLM